MPQLPLYKQIQDKYTKREIARRECARRSNDALNKSKRAIFALHRRDEAGAKKLLDEATALFEECETRFKKSPDLRQEGQHQAALEEYAEAVLFLHYVKTGKIVSKVEARINAPHTFIGGLSDATGEIVRDAVRQATEGKYENVEHARKVVESAVALLLDLDLTGHLRNKADQAKRNLRQLEQMLYEVSLRK